MIWIIIPPFGKYSDFAGSKFLLLAQAQCQKVIENYGRQTLCFFPYLGPNDISFLPEEATYGDLR